MLLTVDAADFLCLVWAGADLDLVSMVLADDLLAAHLLPHELDVAQVVCIVLAVLLAAAHSADLAARVVEQRIELTEFLHLYLLGFVDL